MCLLEARVLRHETVGDDLACKIRWTADWSDIKVADPRLRDAKNRASSADVLRKLEFAKREDLEM